MCTKYQMLPVNGMLPSIQVLDQRETDTITYCVSFWGKSMYACMFIYVYNIYII